MASLLAALGKFPGFGVATGLMSYFGSGAINIYSKLDVLGFVEVDDGLGLGKRVPFDDGLEQSQASIDIYYTGLLSKRLQVFAEDKDLFEECVDYMGNIILDRDASTCLKNHGAVMEKIKSTMAPLHTVLFCE